MKDITLFEKILVGAFSIRIGKKYLSFPKTAPFMTTGLLLIGLFRIGIFNANPLVLILGLILTGLGLISFFYFDIFKKRQPKTKEEAEKFITVINEKES